MTYISEVIADAPKHYWRLADPGGILYHDIGSSPFHLVATTPAVVGYSGPNVGGRSADFTQAANFCSTNDAVLISNIALTVECWCWPYANFATSTKVATAWTPGGSNVSLFSKNGQWGCFAGGLSVLWTPGADPSRQWHHLALTYSAGSLKLFVDGGMQASGVPGGLPAAAGNLRIGMDTDGTGSFNGFISEVAYYTTALSNARILAHYLAADNASQPPVFLGGGTFSLVTGSTVATIDDIAEVLNAVTIRAY